VLEDRQRSRDHVAEIVLRLLSGYFQGRDVPSPLISAVVDGTGDPPVVQRLTREACGDDKPFDLVRFDTDQIAGYVFESSRPPVIAGASPL